MSELKNIRTDDLQNINGGAGDVMNMVAPYIADYIASGAKQLIQDIQSGIAANQEKAKQKEISEDIARRRLL